MNVETLIADTAERAMAGRSLVERSEIVTKVLEALVTDVLERDPRFFARASFFGLTARRESDELARRRQEEETALAASSGEWTDDWANGLQQLGVPFGAYDGDAA